jgi:hypothetical protein
VTVAAPALLDGSHLLDVFDCVVPALDEWLERLARGNAASGASHTYVGTEGNVVVGYFALAAGGVDVTSVPGQLPRNMTDPVPIVILGRLAVNRSQQSMGSGRAPFRDAGCTWCGR